MENKSNKLTSSEEKIKKETTTTKANISKEFLQERELLAGLLVQSADALVDAEKHRRKLQMQEIELLSGKKITINEIQQTVTALRQPYVPMFGNSLDFFREMYRLLDWTDKNPNSFAKPAIVGEYINELLYARFHKDVQPTLHALAVPGGIRRDKFFQYLTLDGKKRLEQFRDEAIQLMKDCKSWYEFRVRYGQQYSLPVQKRMFEEYQASHK